METGQQKIQETFTDTERLDWLARSGAHVAHARDGGGCWLHWSYGDYEGDGRSHNQKGLFSSSREAIDDEMRREKL